MRIDDEIKGSFVDDYHRALVNLIFTSSYFESRLSTTLKQYGITRQQYNVLRILRGQQTRPASILLIKTRMLDKMSDASRIVDRLIKKGLVEKSVCSADRRSKDILITLKGLDLLQQLDPIINKHNSGMEVLTSKEVRSLNRLLDKLRNGTA